MESAEAEKSAILAEIEEIAGLGKDKHLRFGTYHETSYGSKVVAYSRLFGIDYLYRPSLKADVAVAPKVSFEYDKEEGNIQYFFQLIEHFDDVDWYEYEEGESDLLSYRDKLMALKLEVSPFEELRESVKRQGYTLAQSLDTIRLAKSFQRIVRHKISRKDKKRERRDKDTPDNEASSHIKFRRDKAIESLPLEQKLSLERMTILVAKAIIDGDLSSFLGVLSVVLSFMQNTNYTASESYLLPVGNLLSLLFDRSFERFDKAKKLASNPFLFFANKVASSQTKGFTGSDLARHELRFDEVVHDDIRRSHFMGTSDAGSTIGSTHADIGTDTASIMDDEMNEDDMLAHALALSVGDELPPKSDGGGDDRMHAATPDIALNESVLEFSELVNFESDIKSPFSATAPFRCKEFMTQLYGQNPSQRISSNLVSLRTVFVSIVAALNLSVEKKVATDSTKSCAFCDDSGETLKHGLSIPIVSSVESISCLEFLVNSIKMMIAAHTTDDVTKTGGATIVEKTKDWHLHLYLLTWSLQSVLRLSSELLSRASMRAMHLQSHGTSGGTAQIKRAVSRLRDDISEMMSLSNVVVKPPSSVSVVSSPFNLTKYPETFPVNIKLEDISKSMFASSSESNTLVLDYRFCQWNMLHNLRLAAIDAYLSLLHINTDPVGRLEALYQLISTTTTDSEHLLLNQLHTVLLCDLQHALGNGDVIYLKEYNLSCPEDLYSNYFLQRMCVEVLKSDDLLAPYFVSLTSADKMTGDGTGFDVDEKSAQTLQKLMKAILNRLHNRALSSNFYGTTHDNGRSRLWGELDFIRCAQNFVFDKIDRELVQYWENKGLLYQEFKEDPSHPNLSFSDDMKVVSHIGWKAWCSVIASTGLEPNTGVYEWTIKIDHCSKGHVFLGIATSDMACEKDGYIGVDKNSWGLIGTRSLWHNRTKIRADYGSGFGSGSLVTTIYDSDNHTVSFRCDGQEWGVAFENIPKVKVFPAFSLHERGDQVSMLRCIRRENATGSLGKSTRGNSLDIRTDTWPGFFAEYCQTVLAMSDRTVASLYNTGEERILLSPIVTTLSASLIAYTQSPRFSYLADSPIIVSILPYLTVFSRRLANLSEKLSGKKSAIGVRDADESHSEEQSMLGQWKVRHAGSSTAQQWLLEPLAVTTDDTNDDDADHDGSVASSVHHIVGKVLSDGPTSVICGVQEKSKFKLHFREKGSTVTIDGRLTLCGRYFFANQIDTSSGKLNRLEGFMCVSNSRHSPAVEIQTLKKLTLLTFSSGSLLAGKLVGDSISSDRFRDLEVDDAPVDEMQMVLADSSEKATNETNEDTPTATKDWTDSVLFSGGIALSTRNLEAVNKFLAAYLSKYCPVVKELVVKRLTGEEAVDSSMKSDEHLAAWLDFVLPIKADVGEDIGDLKYSPEDPEVGTEEASFYSALLEGKAFAASLDEYVCLFAGQAGVLKLGGAIMNRTRKMVIVSLIQHSGCYRVCDAEIQALQSGEKTLTDRPAIVLLEIWRAAIRVIENIIRIKQATGDSYENICRGVCRKAEFMGQIDPSKACGSIHNTFMFLDKSQIINDRWYLEAGLKVHSIVSKLIAEATDFFTNSTTNIDSFAAKLIERTADCFLRIAGFKSYLCLLGKHESTELSSSKVPMYTSGGIGLQHEYHTMALSHLPVFRQNAVVMNAQQHYGSGLRGVCQKAKSTLQYAFEQLYELITQHLTKSTWAKDREGQLVALKAWNIVIQPDDHLLLNRMNLFRTLHSVLDDVRGSIYEQSHDEREHDVPYVLHHDLRRDQLDFLTKARREFSLTRHTSLAQLILDTVHSLAAQIASASENVADDLDLGAAHLLRRTSSGPDTLSRSLFDLMFAEYMSSVKTLMSQAIDGRGSPTEARSPMPSEDDTSRRGGATATANAALTTLIEGEDYLYRILNLLKMVAQSKNCLKLLQGVKWVTSIVSAIGFGTLTIQRRIFRLLRILLTSANVAELFVCVPNFFDSRPILKLESTSDTDEFVAACAFDAANSIGLYPGHDADGVVCFLLECVSLLVPDTSRAELFDTWADAKSLRSVVGYESLSLLRVLLGIPAWRTVIFDRFARILNDPEGAVEVQHVARSAVYYVLGGAFDKRRVGGLITVRPFSLLGASDANRGNALAFSKGIILSLSSGASSAEVILVNQALRIQHSGNHGDTDDVRYAIDVEVPKSSLVRFFKINLSDMLPVPDVPVLSCTISGSLMQTLLTHVRSQVTWAKELTVQSTSGSTSSSKATTMETVNAVSALKLLALAMQNEAHAHALIASHFDVFADLLAVSGAEAGSLGLASLEATDNVFSELISQVMPTKSRPPSTTENIAEEDLESESSSNSNSNNNGNGNSSSNGNSNRTASSIFGGFSASSRGRDNEQQSSSGRSTSSNSGGGGASSNQSNGARDLASMLSPFTMAFRGVDPAMQAAALSQMMEIGLPREWCEYSLRRCHYNVELAINMCLEHGDEMPQLIAQEAELEAQRQRMQQQQREQQAQRFGRRSDSDRSNNTRNDPAALLRQLADIGFPPSFGARAIESGNASHLDAALSWLMARDDLPIAPNHRREEAFEQQSEHDDSDSNDGDESHGGRATTAATSTASANTTATASAEANEPLPIELVSVNGSVVIKKDLTCSTQTGGFPSVGCRRYPVASGKWYYELTVVTAGCVQVGWVTEDYRGDADNGQGVGDDLDSWAYDGWRCYMWHVVSAKWGARWKAGDVVGCAVDLDARTMSFYLNGHGEEIGMGLAVNLAAETRALSVFPCVSFNRNEVVKFNFGATAFAARVPEGYQPYHLVFQAASAAVPRAPMWAIRWGETPADEPATASPPVHVSLPQERSSIAKLWKRYFRSDEQNIVSNETTDFFTGDVDKPRPSGSSSGSGSGGDIDASLAAVAKKLIVQYARLIVLRALKAIPKMDAVQGTEAVSKLLDRSAAQPTLIAQLFQQWHLVSLFSNRTKSYQLLHTMQSCTAVDMGNLGSVLCTGGQPALFELQPAIQRIVDASMGASNFAFADEAMKCIETTIDGVVASTEASNVRWTTDIGQLPVVVRDKSKDEAHWKQSPSITIARALTAVLTPLCLKQLSHVKELRHDTPAVRMVRFLEQLVAAWCKALACPIEAISLVAIKTLSYIMQDIIVFRKDNALGGQALTISPALVALLRRTCLDVLDNERLSQPVLSEYNSALLELTGAVTFIQESFAAEDAQAEAQKQQQLQSPLDELDEEANSPLDSWEVRTGRLLSSENDWQVWTGRVHFPPVPLPGSTSYARWKERQELPPELLPGCKVMQIVAKTPNPAESRLQREIRDWASREDGADESSPLSQFRAFLERARGEDSSDRSVDTSAEEPRLGTVVEVTTWPGSSDVGNARKIKWDDDGSVETVRWGAEDAFDVVHCNVNSSHRVVQKYPNPPTVWQKLSLAGFGKAHYSSVLVRWRDISGCASRPLVAIVDWPEYSASVYCRGERMSDDTIVLIEERLIYGSNHSGWEARFGAPHWRPGTRYALTATAAEGGWKGTVTCDVEVAHRSFALRGTIQVQNQMLFTFEEDIHASNVVVSTDATSVSKPSGGGQGCAVGSVGFSSGVHYWEFKVEQGDIGSIFVGVVEKPEDVRQWRLTRWQGWGMVNNRSSYHTAQMAFGERVNVYGDHFQSGDVLGVVLDLNKGSLSFFLDGLKYGEHLLTDLGVAHEHLHVGSTRLKPRTFYPIVGLSKPMDRVTITKRWLSIPGFDSVEAFKLYERSFQLLYSWNLERASAPLRQHLWIYREGWRHYNRWLKNDAYRCKMRVNVGTISIALNKTPRACVEASLRLGLSHPLLHGDRVVFTKSAGKPLDAKEEAIILGSYRGLLWYKLEAHDVTTEEVIETGAVVWFLVPSDIEGMSLVKRGVHSTLPSACWETALPRLPEFHGGFIHVFHDNGAVMRDGIEIDTSEIITTVPMNTTVYAIERRVNSSNIPRYLVFYAGQCGWISERMRGGSEETMVRRVAVNDALARALGHVEELRSQVAAQCKNVYVLNRLYQPEVASLDDALRRWDSLAASVSSGATTTASAAASTPSSVTTPVSFDEYLRLSSTVNGAHAWSVEADMQLAELLSKLAFQKNKHPMNLSMQDVQRGVQLVRDQPTHLLHAIATDRIVARAAILREANLIFYHTLPMMTLETPEERTLLEVFGTDSVIDVVGSDLPQPRTPQRSTLSRLQDLYREVGANAVDASDLWSSTIGHTPREVLWKPASLAKRWRSLRRLLFTQTKQGFWESVLDATTTPTPLPADEYEDPREIKTIKINRIQATTTKLSTIHSATERLKQSVFGQLHKELRSWSNAAFRRSYVGKGHGGQKRAFKVKFVGEGVNDYGGPYRAVFEQIVDELCCDSLAVGGTRPVDRCLLPLLIPSINRVSSAGSNQDKFLLMSAAPQGSSQDIMSFFGKLIGLSTRHHFNMALDLSALVWRPLVRLPVSLAHLETVDNFAVRNVQQVVVLGLQLEADAAAGRIANDHVPDEWTDLSFVAFLPDGTRMPLIPGGENIAVNVSNWRDYVQLMERTRLQESAPMFSAFREGIASVLPVELFPLFTANELEHLLCGNRVVDIDLIRRCTEYEDLDPNSPLVQQFWEVLQEMTDEDKTSFLRFVWARSRMPSSAKDLAMHFKLQRLQGLSAQQTDSYLPHAQTCFFSLALPTYSSKEILRDKLLYAIKNSPNMDADVRLHTAEGWGDS